MSTSGSFNRPSSSSTNRRDSIDRVDEYPSNPPSPVPEHSPPPYEPTKSSQEPVDVDQGIASSSTPDFQRARIGSAVFTPRSVASPAGSVAASGSQQRLRPGSAAASRPGSSTRPVSSSSGRAASRSLIERDASPEVRQRLMSQSPSLGQQQQQSTGSTLDPEAGKKYIADKNARARSALNSAGGWSRPTSSTASATAAALTEPKEERNFLEQRAASVERSEYTPICSSMCGDECNTTTKLAIGGGIALFIVSVTLAMIIDSAHTVDEGTVGIYFVQGALDDRISFPGVHWSVPFVTNVEEVTVRPRTDTLSPIGATTKDGIQNTFRDIQVISDVTIDKLVPLVRKFGLTFRKALVFDRVNEEVRTFCAKHTIDEVYNTMFLDMVEEVKGKVEASIERIGLGGIKILNLAIPKPEIPSDIAQNYKQVKVQWTEQLVATQQQKTEQIKKETQSIMAVQDAERQKKVLAIDIEKEVLRKQGEKDLSTLENQIVKEREESVADIENYKKRKYAEANQLLYTDSYIKLEMAKHLSNNTKFFFSGENSIFGSLLTGILEGKN